MIDPNKKIHIAVVDDDVETLEMMTAYFKPKGYVVKCFSNAIFAILESKVSGESWDVLLTDYHFPEISGVDFTLRIRERLPNLPIILITPLESTETAVKAIEIGAYDIVTKPIQFTQLQLSVERALKMRDMQGDLIELREISKFSSNGLSKIVGRSPKFLQALDVAKRVAPSQAPIFITGESGSGKEVFANYIHAQSRSSAGPFVAINCSAIPENLLESELFGHAKGSFTGAIGKKIGLFEEAQDGTLFLDEIGDLSLSLQAKLLRVLQEKKIKRVGENQTRNINCRIISATHKDLSNEVNEKRFREDLYFRLNVIPIQIPPLRDRVEDLLLLAQAFLKKFALQNGTPVKTLSKEAIEFVLTNPWRGNVRELENTIERAVVLSSDKEISLFDIMPLNSGLGGLRSTGLTNSVQDLNETFFVNCGEGLLALDEVVQKYIEYAVQRNGGARDRTAKEIGIDRKTLYKRMKADGASAETIPPHSLN